MKKHKIEKLSPLFQDDQALRRTVLARMASAIYRWYQLALLGAPSASIHTKFKTLILIYKFILFLNKHRKLKKFAIYEFLYFLSNQTYIYASIREIERERDWPFQRCRSQRVHFQRHRLAMDGKRELKSFCKA